MNAITLTTLRRKLFRVVDRVLCSGTPVRIRRGTRFLTLSADVAGKGPVRLARLKRRKVISGDASTLWKVKPGAWRGRRSAG